MAPNAPRTAQNRAVVARAGDRGISRAAREEDEEAAADVVEAARKQTGSPLQSLAVLTDVLPDDTYVTTLGLRQRKLTVSGRSASAARLIGAMAANPMIHSPAFVAPVVRDETKGDQMFSIRADLGP